MNNTSSRSHAVFIIKARARDLASRSGEGVLGFSCFGATVGLVFDPIAWGFRDRVLVEKERVTHVISDSL